MDLQSNKKKKCIFSLIFRRNSNFLLFSKWSITIFSLKIIKVSCTILMMKEVRNHLFGSVSPTSVITFFLLLRKQLLLLQPLIFSIFQHDLSTNSFILIFIKFHIKNWIGPKRMSWFDFGSILYLDMKSAVLFLIFTCVLDSILFGSFRNRIKSNRTHSFVKNKSDQMSEGIFT